ncbi:Putative porin [Robiginitalea myxolifaciens]|uniref:Putative porin n=1 Tax=Robiginitalea myxolifaciens TaxID=400055 RepID=A0A1I6GDE1_9FLAO|nr:putative porin [Robiginitalea myxolifaciens]SFR40234.1 Putative porin [Robiginitalea myxolifaciens]
MKVAHRKLLLSLALLWLTASGAQVVNPTLRQDDSFPQNNNFPNDPNRETRDVGQVITDPNLKITDYKIISHQRDTTFLDTTLTIEKEYRYNFLRQDDFELMPFANIGQPYNRLGADLRRVSPFPGIGASARDPNYIDREEVSYYNVATPTTDLFFKTTLEQGQLLDAMVTTNFSRRTNLSLAFKGFRSRGKYQQEEVTSGNFRATFNHQNKKGTYTMRAHIVAQDILAQENGGLANSEAQFESGDSDFTDRSRLDVRFNNVQNQRNGKRYYLDHSLKLLGKKSDSTVSSSGVYLGHQLTYETQWFQYNQNTNNTAYFGDAIFTPVKDQAYLKTFDNRLSLHWENKYLGKLGGFAQLFDYQYFFRSILITEEQTIPSNLSDSEVLTGAFWEKSFGPISLQAEGGLGLIGDLTDSYLNAHIRMPLGEKFSLDAGIHHSARKPNFNMLLYQSGYVNFNWDNSSSFENEQVQSLFGRLESDRFGTIEARLSTISNFSYFASSATAEQIGEGREREFIRPVQQSDQVSYLRLKYQKEFKFGSWALNNTVLYQEVDQSADVLNLPTLVTRNTLYFSSEVFKKAMYLQTGVTFKYFTSYYMDAYNPLMAEFYVQNQEKLGGFPMLDFFINARVQQTRIYLKAEHFNSFFSQNNFFAAPDYPYRDFVIRFGLVWNFFS